MADNAPLYRAILDVFAASKRQFRLHLRPLTQALRPLDRAALEDVAEAMSELANLRRDVAEIEAMRKAIGSFGAR
jgi:hypothetical protein